MRASTLIIVAAIALGGVVQSAAAADCTFAGRSRIRLGTRGQSAADLAVNDPLGRAQLGRNATLADDTAVTADLVGLNNGASVFDVAARLLQTGRGAEVRGTRTEPTLPLDPTFCAPVEVAAGGPAVTARRGDRTITLQPGSFGAVELENGTHLVLEAGEYAFESIKTGWNVAIEVTGTARTTIAVSGDVRLGNRTTLGPATGTPTPLLRVGGDDVGLGAGSEIAAVIDAPDATVRLGRRGKATGGGCAEAFLTGNEVELACAEDVTPTTSTTTTPTTSSSSTTTTTTSTSSTTEPEPTTTTTTSSTTSTLPSSCGDAFVSAPEECDDGNENSADGCTNACTICGNGTTTAPETCDDGDLESGDGCDANCTVTACGNGILTEGETCDDGNAVNNDACPSNCVIDACTPLLESTRTVAVTYAGSSNVAGIVVLVDYPEGKVNILGSGPEGINAVSDIAGDGFAAANDLDHALRVAVNSQTGGPLPGGLLFNVTFNDCSGAPVPPSTEFTCTVLSASAPDLQPVPGVTCMVVIEGETTTTTITSTTSSTSSTTSTTAPSTTTSTTVATTTTSSSSSTTTSSSSTTTSSTSSSSTTTSSSPPSTTTSTTVATTTTSSSSSTTTSSSSTTTSSTSSSTTTTTTSSTSTTVPTLCGNGAIDPGETCDDNNTNNADACPSDCAIDTCTPLAETNLRIAVFFTPPAGGLVAGITLLVDYPEGRVLLPATGDTFPTGVITNTPGGAAVARFDFEHALRMTIGRATALVPATQLFRANFQTCQGAPPATAQDFTCTVLNASDPFSNPVAGATCSVTIVP